jgi:hypothetical protein
MAPTQATSRTTNNQEDLQFHIQNAVKGDAIQLDSEQKIIFNQQRPDLITVFNRPVNTGKRRGTAKYYLNHIQVPKYFHNVKQTKDSDKWYAAMQTEIDSIDRSFSLFIWCNW